MSWRKLANLLAYLPPESATKTQLRVENPPPPPDPDRPAPKHDPEPEQWSRVEHLLAALIDQTVLLRHQHEVAATRKEPATKFEPYPRPGLKKQEPTLDLGAARVLWNLLNPDNPEPDPESDSWESVLLAPEQQLMN